MNNGIIIAQIIAGGLELWRNHANKPADWIPTPEEWQDLQTVAAAATPENEKKAARLRLGIPEPTE